MAVDVKHLVIIQSIPGRMDKGNVVSLILVQLSCTILNVGLLISLETIHIRKPGSRINVYCEHIATYR